MLIGSKWLDLNAAVREHLLLALELFLEVVFNGCELARFFVYLSFSLLSG